MVASTTKTIENHDAVSNGLAPRHQSFTLPRAASAEQDKKWRLGVDCWAFFFFFDLSSSCFSFWGRVWRRNYNCYLIRGRLLIVVRYPFSGLGYPLRWLFNAMLDARSPPGRWESGGGCGSKDGGCAVYFTAGPTAKRYMDSGFTHWGHLSFIDSLIVSEVI